ncbi:MAG: hypothetical protein ACREV7_16890 [Steroidobacteraceae bacterium]
MKAKSLVLAIAAAACVTVLPAYAHPMVHFQSGRQLRNVYQDPVRTAADPSPTPAAAPEIDPEMAAGALTLLAGGLAVLRGRRRKDG